MHSMLARLFLVMYWSA